MISTEEKDEIIRSQQDIIKDHQKIIDEMKDALREIGNFTDGLRSVVSIILADSPECAIVDLTFKKILELVEQNI